MGQVTVNSDEIYQLSQKMGELAVTLHDLGINLGTLNSKAESFIANWLTSSGRFATGKLLGSRTENELLTQDIGTLCVKLARAADGYLGAEEKAIEMLRQYDRGLPSGWAVQSQPNVGRDLINDSIIDQKIHPQLEETTDKAIKSGNPLYYLKAKILFGAERYMDIRANRGNPYGLAKQSKISEELWKFYDMAGKGYSALVTEGAPRVDSFLRRNGIVRNLDHAEIITDLKAREDMEDLRVPQSAADFAHNEWVLSHIDENVDIYMAEQGRVVQYQGVVVQIIENPDGVQTAIVYIPGTDSDSLLDEVSGEPATWTADIGEGYSSSDQPLSEGTASMQLVEEALKQAGVQGGSGLILAGFSKGGATAYNFAHNKEMQAKYEMRGIYDQAGPTGRRVSSGKDIPHIKVTNQGDFVSFAGGDYSDEQNDSMHSMEIDSGSVGRANEKHGYDIYNDTAQADPEMNAKITEFQEYTADAHQVGDSQLVAGSTLPKDMTQEKLDLYQGAALASAAYDLVDGAEEVWPQKVNVFGVNVDLQGPDLVDLPAIVSDENRADEYLEVGYKIVTGKDWDSTPPTVDFSPEQFVENEKAYEFTLGKEDKPHLDVQIDDGTYTIDVDLGDDGNKPFELLERAKEYLEEQFPDTSGGWDEKPTSTSQWEKPGHGQPVTEPQNGFEYTPAAPQYAGVGGNF